MILILRFEFVFIYDFYLFFAELVKRKVEIFY